MSSLPYVFPENTQWPQGSSNAFDGLNDDHTYPGYTPQHAYTSHNSSNVPSNFGNADGHYSGPQASYSYGSNQFPNEATPGLHLPRSNMPYHQSNDANYQQYQQSPPSYSTDNSHSTQYFPNNGAHVGYAHQPLYGNDIQLYPRTPSQQFPPPTNGQVENTTEERDATGQQYFLPPPPDARPPSPIPQLRDQTVHPAPATTFHSQSAPVPANSWSSSGAPAKPKGRQPKATKPAGTNVAKADKKPGRRAAPPAPTPAPAPHQESSQGVNGDLDAKAPVKRAYKKRTPVPKPSPATATTAATTEPASAAAPEKSKSQHANKSKAAPADKSQVTPASNATVQGATKLSRSRSILAGGTAVKPSKSLASLNKRKRDEQDDNEQRDRDLMPPPAAPSSNFSNGKGKGKSAEPPAPVAPNQINPNAQAYNLSTVQFVLPSGVIALSPCPPAKGDSGMVWIIDQICTGIAWPAKLHTNGELADVAYRKAFNSSFQRIIYLPRHPMTDNGKVSISSLILITLGVPKHRSQVPFDAVNAAKVIPPEQVSRFLEQLHFQERCRRSMMFEETSESSGFRSRGPINALMQTPSGQYQYPSVGGSGSNRQFSGVQQAMPSARNPSIFPSSSSGYFSSSTSNTQNRRFMPQERAGSETPADGQSTAPQELPYPFSSYPSATETAVDPVTTSGSGTPSTEGTASTEAAEHPSTTQDVVDEAPDNVLGDVDFWTKDLVDDNSQAEVPSSMEKFHIDPNLLKGMMGLTNGAV
ncbi:hypothetical protein BDZ89DRAFT_1076140 [Hymenopellis radicata]|nr:hypothetical protein BDZ89DRAFT_1076140 [Hymenopellis radicata]